MSTVVECEVDQNFTVFQKLLPSLIESRHGQHVLLHRGKIVDYYSTSVEAYINGCNKFGSGNFSVQEVTDQIENLGFYSYAGSAGQA
jgi:hypothetical protein